MTVTTFSISYAQKDNKQRMTREQLAETQAKYIAKEMAMDEATSAKFVTTFTQSQNEIWALGGRPRKDTSKLSDAEAEQAIKERFEHSQKVLDIRKKYYTEYSKFLTPSQIEQIYKLEKRMMERLQHRAQQRKNLKNNTL